MKKIFSFLGLALLFASCDGDYTDWAQPNEETQNPIAVEVSAAEAPSIQFGNNMDADIQIFVPTINAEEGATVNYLVALYDAARANKVELEANAQGKVSTDELKAAIIQLYGKRPVEREVPVVVEYAIVNGKAMLTNAETYLYVSLDPNDVPVIENHYYYVGATNNWSDSDMTYELKNGGGDVYDDPIFTAVIPAPKDGDGNRVDNWFKIAPESAYTSGDFWNNLWGVAENGDASLTGNLAFGDIGAFCMPASDGAVAYKISIDMLGQTYEITPLTFGEFVYFIGATDGWSQAVQKLASPDFDGVYTGYIYCADPNGWGNEFKFQKVPGDWGSEINSGHMTGGISGDFADGGGNIKATAGEGLYYVELDLLNNTLKSTRIYNMNLVGNFNGWNPADDAQTMTWNATDYCFEITGAGVTADGWKFTANNGWGINLGGDINDLTQDGDNLAAVGTTIKLYPTRKTSDKIYCTVE